MARNTSSGAAGGTDQFPLLAHARDVVQATLSPDSVAPRVVDPILARPLSPFIEGVGLQSGISMRSSLVRTPYSSSGTGSSYYTGSSRSGSTSRSFTRSFTGSGSSYTHSGDVSASGASLYSGPSYPSPQRSPRQPQHASPSPRRTALLAQQGARTQMSARLQRFAMAEQRQAAE